MKACFTKNTTKNKKNKRVLNPGSPAYELDALPFAPRKPATDESVNLSSLNLLPMKFCRSPPFEASRAFIKN